MSGRLGWKDVICKVTEWCNNPPWETGDGTGTDDQQLSLVGNVLVLEDGSQVDLTPLLAGAGTDDQQITNFVFDPATNDLTITLEDGGTSTTNLAALLDDTDTDDQTLALAGTILTIADGNSVDLASIDTDDQTLSIDCANDELSIDGGNSIQMSVLGRDRIYSYDLTPGVNARVWIEDPLYPHLYPGDWTGPADPTSGYLLPTADAPTVTTITNNFSVSDTQLLGQGVAGQYLILDGWVRVPDGALIRDNNQNTGELGFVSIGSCCGGPMAIQPGFNDVTNTDAAERSLLDSVLAPSGWLYVWAALSDLSAFAGFDLEYSIDGGATWQNVTELSATMPTVIADWNNSCSPLPDNNWFYDPPQVCCQPKAVVETTSTDDQIFRFNPVTRELAIENGNTVDLTPANITLEVTDPNLNDTSPLNVAVSSSTPEWAGLPDGAQLTGSPSCVLAVATIPFVAGDGTQRKAPVLEVYKNGNLERTVSTGYIRNASGHAESSWTLAYKDDDPGASPAYTFATRPEAGGGTATVLGRATISLIVV